MSLGTGALDQRDPALVYLAVAPQWESLRDDLRFTDRLETDGPASDLRPERLELLGEHAMDKGNCDRSFANGRRYALDVAAPHVAYCEHARK